MNTTIRLMIGAAALGALVFATPAAAAPHGVKVGTLTCDVDSGWGLVFGSSRDLHCNFHPVNGRTEHYVGSVSKFGVDIGYTDGGVLIWGVFSPSSDIRSRAGALEGDYVGASASATVGVGVGANVLVGGFDKSITLQPVSVEGEKGLNVAAGIGSISLKFQPTNS